VIFTPQWLVDFMVRLARPHRARCRVLEPACADAPFLHAFAEAFGRHHELLGVEIDADRLRLARHRLPEATFLEEDFLLWEPQSCPERSEWEGFDIIIGNPPYGIIGDASHYPLHVLKERKSLYRRRTSTWHGKYNIYGAFIEKAVRLLAPDGRLVFVVPASWLVLDDFRKLRRFLAESGRLKVFYLSKVFPRRQISVVVLVLERGGEGIELIEATDTRWLARDVYHGEMIRFESAEWLALEREGIPLGECFSIHFFAARSPEVKQHPAVSSTPSEDLVPVLTGRNLHAGWIDYDTCYSGLWLPRERAVELRAFYGFSHLVVAHTKGTRVVCAVDQRCYPWREEFHLVPKREGLNLYHIMEYLHSEPIQRGLRTLYRDFVPHLTATMLAGIPWPKSLVD